MIVSCGEALIDFVPMTGADGKSGYLPCPGGSPYNAAIGLARLGVPTAFLGRISTDFFGDLLIATLKENDVHTDLVCRAPDPSTLAFVSHSSAGEPQYAFYASGAADRSMTGADLPTELPQAVELLHFGSISLVLEPMVTTLESLMRREAGRRLLSLDPNVRPNLISDRQGYLRRLESWIALMDLIKVSQADLDWLYPDQPPEKAAQAWRALGPKLVVVTLGSRGALALGAAGEATVSAAPAKVVDTVGAGDSFLSAFLAWLREDVGLNADGLVTIKPDRLARGLSFACRAAALTCSRPGAHPPSRRELDK